MDRNLTKFRNARKMSIKQMAEVIGVSKSYYEKIEYGERSPSYNFITKFSTKFPDEDIDFLFFERKNHVTCD